MPMPAMLAPSTKAAPRPNAKRARVNHSAEDEFSNADDGLWREEAVERLQSMSRDEWLQAEVDRLVGQQCRNSGDFQVLDSLQRAPLEVQFAATLAACDCSPSSIADFSDMLAAELAAREPAPLEEQRPAKRPAPRPSMAPSAKATPVMQPKSPPGPPPSRKRASRQSWPDDTSDVRNSSLSAGDVKDEDEEDRLFIEVFVPVPKNLIPKVIGKGGSNIKAMKEKSGAHVIDARNQSADPVQVRVVGTRTQVEKAEQVILETIDGCLNKFKDLPYLEVAKENIGLIMGDKGRRIATIQAESGAKLDVEFMDPCRIYVSGSEEEVEKATYMVNEALGTLDDQEVEYLDFPLNCAGAILGKKGQRVLDIQTQSGAFVDLDKSGGTCQVRVRGATDAIRMATAMIRETVNTQCNVPRWPS